MKKYLQIKKWKKILKKSRFFDAKYYIFTYPDVRFADIDPVEHYIKYGVFEGKNPSIEFDTLFYLEQHKDVAESGINPLVHYIMFGENEQRNIRRVDGNILCSKTKKEDVYQSWKAVNKINKNKISLLKYHLLRCTYSPKISVIIPVYNPPLLFLTKALDSVKKQIYTNWEICIVDDASTDISVKPYLIKLQQDECSSIKVHFNLNNVHISESTNMAVKMANGDYLVFLDQDDELTPDALAEVVLYINKEKDTDLLYSDDDKIDEEGKTFAPQFKPVWSPEYLLSFMYVGHLKCVKKSLYEEIGGFRMGYEGSQDYDFYLRASERARKIGHIPKILYHWRVLPGSTAANGNEKRYSFQAGINALQDTLVRRNVLGVAYQPEWALNNGNGIYAIKFPDEGENVAIIIPTKNGVDLLRRCINSIEQTTYKNYTIYVIDNESDEEEAIDYLNYLNNLENYKVFKIPSPNGVFSYSYINNEAAKLVQEELILFLNNDTEVINPKWLSQMVGYLQFNGVGSVGARLLFPDKKIQHAGILHGLFHGFPTTSGRLLPSWEWGYMASTVTSRNFSAVTAGCMLTRKKYFFDLGGFDDVNFSVAFNDCDYGYKLYKAGYRNVLAPEAELFHYEGASRGHGDKPSEEAAYIRKYGQWPDPYYNPNLSMNCSDYSLDAKTVVLHEIPNIRLLMVTHNLNYEGAPKHVLELAKTLKQKGKVEPIILSHISGPLLSAFKKENIDVKIIKDFNLFSCNDSESIDLFLNIMEGMIAELNIDVVYGNTIEAFWAIQCSKKINLPSIWNIHESEEPFSSYNHNVVIKDLMVNALSYPYKVVFVSDATKAIYEYLNTQNNFITIHNGFDEEHALNCTENINKKNLKKKFDIRDDELVVLIVGTVCERKGQIDLIHAIEEIDERYVARMKFFIVGDRKSLQYSKKLHQVIEKLPISKSKKITVVDETSDIHAYYLISDVFVCSSRIESFPKVIQEAMYHELAIITTPVFGIVEQVRNNVSALYYTPGDILKLSENLITMLLDVEKRNRLRMNAKISLSILPTLTEMTDQYLEIIKESWLSGESR